MELEILNSLKQALHLYNQEKYFECHEVLEDLWMESANSPLRDVFWIILQVAVSLYHLRNNNLAGAKSMLLKAESKRATLKFDSFSPSEQTLFQELGITDFFICCSRAKESFNWTELQQYRFRQVSNI